MEVAPAEPPYRTLRRLAAWAFALISACSALRVSNAYQHNRHKLDRTKAKLHQLKLDRYLPSSTVRAVPKDLNDLVLRSVADIPPDASCVWTDVSGGFPLCTGACSEGRCRRLWFRRKCAPFRVGDTDRRVIFDYATGTKHVEWLGREFSVPVCHVGHPCFDLERCDAEGPMNVFFYAEVAPPAMDSHRIRIVQNASDACVLVASAGGLETGLAEIAARPSWRGGRNHLVVNAGMGDFPFATPPRDRDLGLAALAAASLSAAVLRPGFDVPTPTGARLRASDAQRARACNVTRARAVLLSFRGGVLPKPAPGMQHRWIASEFLHDPARGAVADVHCLGADGKVRQMDAQPAQRQKEERLQAQYVDRTDFVESLLDATFALAPGGVGAYSFRFEEALEAGCIPVTTPDLVLPFEPDVQWAECVVRIPETQWIRAYHILRDIDGEEIARRRRACARLYERCIDTDPLRSALGLIRKRVRFAKLAALPARVHAPL